ncbi:hypothetical protein NMY22_g16540 [Coprinellus aureogranulatus]|nr:hypothetical protein NMY22_g16540 [Coprinellus aureogranulatus]
MFSGVYYSRSSFHFVSASTPSERTGLRRPRLFTASFYPPSSQVPLGIFPGTHSTSPTLSPDSIHRPQVPGGHGCCTSKRLPEEVLYSLGRSHQGESKLPATFNTSGLPLTFWLSVGWTPEYLSPSPAPASEYRPQKTSKVAHLLNVIKPNNPDCRNSSVVTLRSRAPKTRFTFPIPLAAPIVCFRAEIALPPFPTQFPTVFPPPKTLLVAPVHPLEALTAVSHPLSPEFDISCLRDLAFPIPSVCEGLTVSESSFPSTDDSQLTPQHQFRSRNPLENVACGDTLASVIRFVPISGLAISLHFGAIALFFPSFRPWKASLCLIDRGSWFPDSCVSITLTPTRAPKSSSSCLRSKWAEHTRRSRVSQPFTANNLTR